MVPSCKPAYAFDDNATYVVSGGLGGIERSIVRWMADRKAKYFLLLSRSGPTNADALRLIEEMTLRGVTIAAPPCDISNKQMVSKVLEGCMQSTPSVKGCI